MAAVDSDAEDFVEVSVHDDTTGQKVAASDFDPHRYTREEICLTIVQVEDFEIPPRTVSRIHEDNLVEFSKTLKYQYGGGLTTVAILAF